MRKLFFAIIYTVLFFSCAQDKKSPFATTKPIEKNMNMEITALNFVDQMVNQTNHFNDQPMYYLRINTANCLYEVLVNDFPVAKMNEMEYNTESTKNPELKKINHAILKSGKQTVTYRLYPIGDLITENHDKNNPSVENLTNDTKVEVEIIRVDDYRSYNSTNQEIPILRHTNFKKEKTNHFIAAGQKYYEYTLSFDSKVPYSNEGWSNGQKLTQLDQKLLNQKTLEYYKAYQEILEKKDANSEARVNFKEELRNSISFYRDRKEIQKIWDEYMNIFWVEKEFQPLENYKMMFYGNGNIISLRQSSTGESPLWFFYREKNFLRTNFPKIYLYLPKGKKLEDGLYMIN